MSESAVARLPVVFDCNVFAQSLINPRGSAGGCIDAAQAGRLEVFVSGYLLRELRLVVSRDRDLLDLMNPHNAEGVALRTQHPTFRVLTPPELLREL